MTEAGWDKINGNKPITWLTYYNTPQAANVMAAVQAMLAQVGINVVPRVVDTPTYNGIVYAGKPDFSQFPLVYAGLQNGPIRGQHQHRPQRSADAAGRRQHHAHRHAGADQAAFDAALAETDPQQLDARYQDVCKAMNAKLPWATMWVANRYGVASAKLKDFVWTPGSGRRPLQGASGEMVDRRSRRNCLKHHGTAARSRSGRLPKATRAYSCCHTSCDASPPVC